MNRIVNHVAWQGDLSGIPSGLGALFQKPPQSLAFSRAPKKVQGVNLIPKRATI